MTGKLEDEIRTALLPGAPDDDTRAAWARAALDRRPEPHRRLHPLWPALAAAALLTAVFWPRTEPVPAPPPVAQADDDEEQDEAAQRLKSTSVDEQRVANTAYLAEAEKRDVLKDARKGQWVIVTGGDSLRMANSLEDALAWADKLYPEAKHRFLFPIANDMFSRGDVIVDRAPVALGTAGSWFFQNVGIEAKGLKEIALEVGGETMKFRVDPESAAPLVLPAGKSFPRFEIPGRMILEDLDRSWLSFRRQFVHVRNDARGIDEWTEVVAAESKDRYAPGNWLAVRLGGFVFHALRKDPAETAAEEGDSLLVLRFREGSTGYLNELFDGVEIEHSSQFAVPRAKRTVLQHYDEKGKLVAELDLPDASAKTRAALREFLRADAPAGLLDLLNELRRGKGVAPLAADKVLAKAAQAHADEMARLGYYGHVSPVPDNRSPNDRLRQAGWGAGRVFWELLAQADSADAALRSWKEKDLLGRGFTVAGVGRNGRYFVLLLGAR
jgi:uncharacterized protein YkwD